MSSIAEWSRSQDLITYTKINIPQLFLCTSTDTQVGGIMATYDWTTNRYVISGTRNLTARISQEDSLRPPIDLTYSTWYSTDGIQWTGTDPFKTLSYLSGGFDLISAIIWGPIYAFGKWWRTQCASWNQPPGGSPITWDSPELDGFISRRGLMWSDSSIGPWTPAQTTGLPVWADLDTPAARAAGTGFPSNLLKMFTPTVMKFTGTKLLINWDITPKFSGEGLPTYTPPSPWYYSTDGINFSPLNTGSNGLCFNIL